MGEDIKLARTAAVKFVNKLPHAEDVTLVDFDTEVRVARYSQAELPRLIERIRMRKADGWTALYDAGRHLHERRAGSGRPARCWSLHRRRRHAQFGELG